MNGAIESGRRAAAEIRADVDRTRRSSLHLDASSVAISGGLRQVASSPQVSGSCETSVARYSDTSSAGNFAASSAAAPPTFSAVRLRDVLLGDQPVLVRDAEQVEKGAHHRPLPLEVIVDERARGDGVRYRRQLRQVFRALLGRAAPTTLLGRNFMCVAIEATASICWSAECSSSQKSPAASTRRSSGMRRHSLDGLKFERSRSIRRFLT